MNGATAILDDSLVYDANSNVVSISDGTAGNINNRNMSFDAADRLTQTNAPNQTWLANTLTYDALDNIRSNSLGSRTYNYQYNATSKRLSQLTLPNTSIARNIGFDAQGNMSSNGAQSYAFDKANRLQSVLGVEAYQYDGHGRRVKITRISDNKISYPIYSLDGKLVTEDDQRSNKSIDYVYLNGSLLAKRSATIGSSTYTASYLHTDVLGSPISESNAAKVVTRIERYTPYGEPSDMALDAGPGFTGHATDVATGLTYMQQRYMDQEIGRFLTPDPVETNPNNGASFNRYWYGNNNPYKFTDPDGRNGVAAFGGVIAESINFIKGDGFDGKMVMGALKDGYDGEGDGFASAAFDDATSFIPVGATAGAAVKLSRIVSQASKVNNLARANKINHIFGKPGHNLGGVAKALGGEKKAFKALEKATNKAVDSSKAGKFETTVKIGGEQVTVRGNVVDGQVKIGTAFLKEELKK